MNAFRVPNQFRIKKGALSSTDADGNNGAFLFFYQGIQFFCIASDGGDWEHVSVSIDRKRTPSWEQMCFVKDLFWESEACVIQYHPPLSRYVNNMEFCLHLWRPIDCGEIPFPPTWMV